MVEIVGHEEIRNKLCSLVKENRVGHAYLFLGKEGIGKKLVAQEFAKNMMCIQPQEGIACGQCESCRLFGNTADFELIQPEKNMIKVDVIRAFEEEVYLKPTHANRKCFLIDDCDCMNESSQNALLKVLEEPPLYTTILLVSNHKEKLLNTIKSRVTEIDFHPLTEEQMKQIVEEKDYSLIPYAGGSVQKLMKLASGDFLETANQLIAAFQTKDLLVINRKINELKSNKDFKNTIEQLLETVLIVCHQSLKQKVEPYLRWIDIIETTSRNIQKNANIELALDNMMIQICYPEGGINERNRRS